MNNLANDPKDSGHSPADNRSPRGKDAPPTVKPSTKDADSSNFAEISTIAANWPAVRSDCTVGNAEGRVAVVTLASRLALEGAAISGPCVTENLGIEKIVANIISNSNIRFLILCGMESRGHLPGDTILALYNNGMDDKGKIIGSRGAIPFIVNLPQNAIDRFQRQVEVIDRIGLEDSQEINRLIQECNTRADVFPEPPLLVMKKRARSVATDVDEGDVILGSETWLSTPAWLVTQLQEVSN
jgi:tetrahydromethanopterin S-methyltransferase subunit A